MRYLGRYTHRIAISNHRLLAFDGQRVTFHWKHYAHGCKQRKMTLDGAGFLRRFFLHVLPKGFNNSAIFDLRVEIVTKTIHTVPLSKLQAWLDSAGPDPKTHAMQVRSR